MKIKCPLSPLELYIQYIHHVLCGLLRTPLGSRLTDPPCMERASDNSLNDHNHNLHHHHHHQPVARDRIHLSRCGSGLFYQKLFGPVDSPMDWWCTTQHNTYLMSVCSLVPFCCAWLLLLGPPPLRRSHGLVMAYSTETSYLHSHLFPN